MCLIVFAEFLIKRLKAGGVVATEQELRAICRNKIGDEQKMSRRVAFRAEAANHVRAVVEETMRRPSDES